MSNNSASLLYKPNNNNGHNSVSYPYLSDPISSSVIDVSDRMLLCSSTNKRNEVVVGGSDHALYAIDVNNSSIKDAYITLYGKTFGHTDWVSSVTHMSDGKILSGGMDGKLCLWSENRRSPCIELQPSPTTSLHPISSVVADCRYDTALSCSYSGDITLWTLGSENVVDKLGSLSISNNRSSGKESKKPLVSSSRISPSDVLKGHRDAVMCINYRDSFCVSGDKEGSGLNNVLYLYYMFIIVIIIIFHSARLGHLYLKMCVETQIQGSSWGCHICRSFSYGTWDIRFLCSGWDVKALGSSTVRLWSNLEDFSTCCNYCCTFQVIRSKRN